METKRTIKTRVQGVNLEVSYTLYATGAWEMTAITLPESKVDLYEIMSLAAQRECESAIEVDIEDNPKL